MRRIEASRRNASALRLRFSQSFASLRQRLSQAKVRSTTQRRGSTTNPFFALDLFARVIAMRIDAAPLFQRSSRFGYRRWRRSGWLLVHLAPDTPHKARDGIQSGNRRRERDNFMCDISQSLHKPKQMRLCYFWRAALPPGNARPLALCLRALGNP